MQPIRRLPRGNTLQETGWSERAGGRGQARSRASQRGRREAERRQGVEGGILFRCTGQPVHLNKIPPRRGVRRAAASFPPNCTLTGVGQGRTRLAAAPAGTAGKSHGGGGGMPKRKRGTACRRRHRESIGEGGVMEGLRVVTGEGL